MNEFIIKCTKCGKEVKIQKLKCNKTISIEDKSINFEYEMDATITGIECECGNKL